MIPSANRRLARWPRNYFNPLPWFVSAENAGLSKNPQYAGARGSSLIRFVGSLGNGPARTNPSTGPFSPGWACGNGPASRRAANPRVESEQVAHRESQCGHSRLAARWLAARDQAGGQRISRASGRRQMQTSCRDLAKRNGGPPLTGGL
jgi:hypothetical protein